VVLPLIGASTDLDRLDTDHRRHTADMDTEVQAMGQVMGADDLGLGCGMRQISGSRSASVFRI